MRNEEENSLRHVDPIWSCHGLVPVSELIYAAFRHSHDLHDCGHPHSSSKSKDMMNFPGIVEITRYRSFVECVTAGAASGPSVRPRIFE